MNLMEEIVSGKITLEEAYCKGHNYVAAFMMNAHQEEDSNITALLHTLNFVESVLAQKYMEERGYYCDNGTGIGIWQKKERDSHSEQP